MSAALAGFLALRILRGFADGACALCTDLQRHTAMAEVLKCSCDTNHIACICFQQCAHHKGQDIISTSDTQLHCLCRMFCAYNTLYGDAALPGLIADCQITHATTAVTWSSLRDLDASKEMSSAQNKAVNHCVCDAALLQCKQSSD